MNQPTLFASDLQDHGIAVQKGVTFSLKPWRDAATGRDYVYAGIISKPSVVVQLDVANGHCRSFPMPPPCGGPWGMAFTLEGNVLVTSTSGHLCRLDPVTGDFRIVANTGHWMWSVDRGPDGKFYLGTSTETRLFRFDAVTEKLEDLGRLDPQEKYLTAMAGNDGYVYGSVGTVACQVVAYHISTGRQKGILPKREVGPYRPQLSRGQDGRVYCRAKNDRLYRLSHGQAFLEAARPTEFWNSTLPDGRVVSLVDLDSIQVGHKVWPLRYQTETNIFHLAAGPAGTVYASTIYPQHLLRYTPATRKLEDLGRGGPDRAEAYSIGHCDGKVYYGTYSTARLMCYDPAKPLHKDPPGQQKWKTNPVLLGYLGKGNCRPRAMCVDSHKRIWVGGVPEYGFRHGGLACYDTRRKKLVVYENVIKDQSVASLAPDASGDIIYGATHIGRGAGLEPVTPAARIFAWDVLRKKILWKREPLPDVTAISNLIQHDGKLYGTTGKPFSFFRFDIKSRKMDYHVPSEISGVREESICFGPDGNIYGITWMVLFRWHPESGRIEELYRCLGEDAKPFDGSLFHRGAVIINDRIYFSRGPNVMSLRLPPFQSK